MKRHQRHYVIRYVDTFGRVTGEVCCSDKAEARQLEQQSRRAQAWTIFTGPRGESEVAGLR